jgi:hypothetical protein
MKKNDEVISEREEDKIEKTRRRWKLLEPIKYISAPTGENTKLTCHTQSANKINTTSKVIKSTSADTCSALTVPFMCWDI